MINLSDRKRLDPAKTRETILTAALDGFAEKGFDGTSIADIAALAQVPKSLLQYHFGAKDELWNACLAHKAIPALEILDRFLEDDATPNLASFVEARFRVLEANPQIARMLAWISLGSAPLPEFLAQRRAQMLQIGARDSSPATLPKLLFALAAMDGWFLNRSLYQRVLGGRAGKEAMEENFLQFLMGTMLSPEPEDTTATETNEDQPKEKNP